MTSARIFLLTYLTIALLSEEHSRSDHFLESIWQGSETLYRHFTAHFTEHVNPTFSIPDMCPLYHVLQSLQTLGARSPWHQKFWPGAWAATQMLPILLAKYPGLRLSLCRPRSGIAGAARWRGKEESRQTSALLPFYLWTQKLRHFQAPIDSCPDKNVMQCDVHLIPFIGAQGRQSH